MNEPIAVGIVHASVLIREGTRDLLSRQSEVRVVGTFGAAREVMEQPFNDDHVLIYDLGTAQRWLRERRGRCHNRLPHAKILMFNVTDDDQAIIECVRVGASGCILQDATLEDLLTAIRSLARGTPHTSPRVITSLFSYVASLQRGDDRLPPQPLTRREEQILQLVAQGLSNKEIAQKLFLRPQTVKNYVHLILQKLDVRNRLELIRKLRSGKH
jgi:DNA-binding NarL/FixJ family response regulator